MQKEEDSAAGTNEDDDDDEDDEELAAKYGFDDFDLGKIANIAKFAQNGAESEYGVFYNFIFFPYY